VHAGPRRRAHFRDDGGYDDSGGEKRETAMPPPRARPILSSPPRARVRLMSSPRQARAALLTGRYASSVGMGYDAIGSFWLPSSYGLPLEHTLLPEAFKVGETSNLKTRPGWASHIIYCESGADRRDDAPSWSAAAAFVPPPWYIDTRT